VNGRVCEQIVADAESVAQQAICDIATAQDPSKAFSPEQLARLQDKYCSAFPPSGERVEWWEKLWRLTDRLRYQWDRIESALKKRHGDGLTGFQDVLDEHRCRLYLWARDFIVSHASDVPEKAHFELGIGVRRADRRGLHERLEGLYESIKRTGKLPTVEHDIELPGGRVNVGLIYGGGWNVSSYSILREGVRHAGLNVLVAFDYPGTGLFKDVSGRDVCVAPAGLLKRDDYLLATFKEPAILHFICPYQWSGPPLPEMGVPVLRSGLTLEIVDDKLETSKALKWYRRMYNKGVPALLERGVPAPDYPADLRQIRRDVCAAVDEFASREVDNLVIKPGRGEQERGVGYFNVRRQREDAVRHGTLLVLESGVLVQERVVPPGGHDFNWRVFVALSPEGEPVSVGRFARVGHGENMEMVADREMLGRIGMTGESAPGFLNKLDTVAVAAYRAVWEYSKAKNSAFPYRPLGGGDYHKPYFLGVDLIGDGYIMEVNGHEVAGMWTDDRLYPNECGRSNRLVLQSAERAGRAYMGALEQN
jgi:hypothetical protein